MQSGIQTYQHKNSLTPNKFRTAPSSGTTVLMMFIDSKGIILQRWLPRKKNLTGVSCALKIHDIRKRGLEFLMKQWFLLQDNVGPHFPRVTKDALAEINRTSILQSKPNATWFWGHFGCLNMNYKGRNSALTLKWKKQPPHRMQDVGKWPTLHV